MTFLSFDPNQAQQFAPQIWLGGYNCLLKQSNINPSYTNTTNTYANTTVTTTNSNFIDDNNIKIIINCGNTNTFLEFLSEKSICSISSDVIILSLDPSFNAINNNQPLIENYLQTYKKKLVNYLQSFYNNNYKHHHLIHDFPNDENFDSLLNSPILYGCNLKLDFFQLNRLIKLFRNTNHQISVLILSTTGNNCLSTGLAISYLMDNYNYHINSSFNIVAKYRPSIVALNLNFYDDLIIVENLKKFYQENCQIKSKNSNYLLTNCHLKRKQVEDDNDDLISAGGEKRFKY